MLVHLDPIYFERQGHRPKYTVLHGLRM